MAEDSEPKDIDFTQAQLAYSIIDSLVEHTRVVSDLIAMMAQVLDEDTTKALTQTPPGPHISTAVDRWKRQKLI
jgi:hypothetical protein